MRSKKGIIINQIKTDGYNKFDINNHSQQCVCFL